MIVALSLLAASTLGLLAWPRARYELGLLVGARVLPAPPELLAGVDLAVVGRGFLQVTDIQFVPGQRARAVILLKEGEARVTRLEAPGAGPIADALDSHVLLSLRVRTESELGLLGLAFHPRFLQNGLFYLNYNPMDGELRTRIAEWHVPPSEIGSAQADERRILLEVRQPFVNHDAGQLAFGPDGYLYIGLGDGGSAGDPHGHGQNLGTLLGSMLRIDVDGRDPGKEYAVPKDNPFVGRSGARPEIWAYGLRNPWRYCFDPQGRLIVADVGQNAWEEIDIVAAGDNLGWKVREGRHCYAPKEGCPSAGLVEPIFEYGRDQGKSVTGGYVYLGSAVPSLRGQYVFGDFVSGRVWSLALPEARRSVEARELGRFSRAISTFGQDADGEIYVGDFVSGEILRFVPNVTRP